MARRNRPRYLSPGVISEGTLKPADLIPSLLWNLKRLRLTRADRAKVRELEREFGTVENGNDDSDTLANVWADLCAVAENYLPDYCSLGGHEGDGACVGVWVNVDAALQDLGDGQLWREVQARNRDGYFETRYQRGDGPVRESVPRGECYLVVSDHGNVSLYQSRGAKRQAREIWGVV